MNHNNNIIKMKLKIRITDNNSQTIKLLRINSNRVYNLTIIINRIMQEIDTYNLCNKIKIIHLSKIILMWTNSGQKIIKENSKYKIKKIIMKMNQKIMILDHNLKKDQENQIIINKINNKINLKMKKYQNSLRIKLILIINKN